MMIAGKFVHLLEITWLMGPAKLWWLFMTRRSSGKITYSNKQYIYVECSALVYVVHIAQNDSYT